MKKPYTTDWIETSPLVEYSKQCGLYWHAGVAYDELSAIHNGIIGPGAQLKEIIKCNNSQELST